MFSTYRTDLDLFALGIGCLIAWHFAGLMPASLIALAVMVLSNRRDDEEYGSTFLTTYFFDPILYAAYVLAFLYSFSCPFIGSDIFGLSSVYASIREFLGIQHCWGFDLLGLPIPPLT